MSLWEKFRSEKGFGLRAKKWIANGSSVIDEVPFVHALDSKNRKIFCNYCYKTSNLKACTACKESVYCSKQCQRALWPIHKHECPNMKKWAMQPLSANELLLFRTLMKLKTDTGVESGHLRSVLDLTESANMLASEIVANGMLAFSGFDLTKLFSKNISSFEDIVHLSAKLGNNDFVIQKDDQRIGAALYLNCSFVNHDCNPNCLSERDDPHDVFRIDAIRDIRPGEEITISYCGSTLLCKHVRQKKLTNYGFICGCHFCINNTFEEEKLRKSDGGKMNEKEIDELDNMLNSTFATLVSTGKDKEVIKMGNAVIRDHHLAPSNVFTIQILHLMTDSAIKQGIDDDDILEYFVRYLPFHERYLGVSAGIAENPLVFAKKFLNSRRRNMRR